MKIKIAAIADTHFDPCTGNPQRQGEIADLLLERTVHRLNEFIKPDVTLILGDLLDKGEAPGARERFQRMRRIVDEIQSPTIVIPGNHDGDVRAFYEVFTEPEEFTDVKGVRFVHFLDPEEPGYNARRTPHDLERMAGARAGFDGPIVALQHVPIFPPGASECPWHYTNAEEVISAMRAHGYCLAVSGHYHEGIDFLSEDGVSFTAAPALCRPPYVFLTITLSTGSECQPVVTRHTLRMPQQLGLVDCHVHTQFAYCSHDMDMERALALAPDFGLAGLAFTEHSGQLYFGADAYWRSDWLAEGIDDAKESDRRIDAYIAAAREANCPTECIGLEADCDAHGRPVLDGRDRGSVGFLIGAIHQTPELQEPAPDGGRVADEFMALLERFLASGIRALAHPFRVFRHAGLEPPPALFGPTVRLLRKNDVAAEINFHANEPPPEFIRQCIESGVRLTFGSDAHSLCLIGDFAPHLELVRACGFDGDLSDILLDPRA